VQPASISESSANLCRIMTFQFSFARGLTFSDHHRASMSVAAMPHPNDATLYLSEDDSAERTLPLVISVVSSGPAERNVRALANVPVRREVQRCDGLSAMLRVFVAGPCSALCVCARLRVAR
jgi:hypothetical protein